MASIKNILVTGATGKQGGALIKALLSSNAPTQYHIYALSRDANSTSSKTLALQDNVTVIQGNMDSASAIFSQLPQSLYGVFSVQTPLKPKVEEAQGKALIDAAVTRGAKHFVYTSVERGGPEKSDGDPTPVPHFISKFNIEEHLKSVAPPAAMRWTIIRPVAFMDNLTNDFLGRAIATLYSFNGGESRTQLISSRDIGKLAAVVFQNPEIYQGRSLSLAAQDISFDEMNEIFKNVTGSPAPRTYDFLGRIIKYLAHEQVGIMFDWFRSDGFGADVNEFRKDVPNMMGFEEWLRTESAWKETTKTK